MDQPNTIENENIESAKEVNGNSTNAVSSYREPLKALVKKIIGFICYGPGVFGFLWLIGRIFKR